MQLYGKSVTPAVDEGAKGEENSKIINEAVVIANDASNISVTGGGIRCGSGESYTNDAEAEEPLYVLEEFNMYTRVIEARKRIRFAKDTARNHILKLNNCMDVNINNIILNESAIWILAINGCDDVQVDNCYFFMPDGMTFGYSGIAIESADGSVIENVKISDIEMDGISSLLLIWIRNRLKYDEKNVGGISDISIKNVQVKNAEMPSAITGCEADGKTYYVQTVTLKISRLLIVIQKNIFLLKNQSVKNQCVIIRRLQGYHIAIL